MNSIHVDGRSSSSASYESSEEEDRIETIRKGPWTEEEDFRLLHHIKNHGEGHWDHLAPAAGLKRMGKSCRFRWLNYLRPGIRRGNFTLQEQLLILELHFRWGNRWSKIAEFLTGRTDNEIKNYWRTRVQKQAKLLKCDVNSKQFHETMLRVWMPRLAEEQKGATSSSSSALDVINSLDDPTDTANMNIRLSSTAADHSLLYHEKESGNLQDTPTDNDCFEVGDFLDRILNDIEFVGFLQEQLFD